MLNELQPYFIPGLLVGFFAWRFLRFRSVKRKLPQLLLEGAIVIDVRSPVEFAAGSGKDSINIPLGDLTNHLNEFDRNNSIVLCCASGTRSAMAAAVLKKNGFKNVFNAGP